MADDGPRYRIDADGWLWQRVRHGSRTPSAGARRLGQVTAITPGLAAGGIRIHYRRDCTPRACGAIGILRAQLVDERGPRRRKRPIAGGSADAPPTPEGMVAVRMIDRKGPIALVEDPHGARVYLVICPHCHADLSTVSHALLRPTPYGEVPEIAYPVRCPECRGALVPAPPKIVTPPRGGLPQA